jgi:hypothetical protein
MQTRLSTAAPTRRCKVAAAVGQDRYDVILFLLLSGVIVYIYGSFTVLHLYVRLLNFEENSNNVLLALLLLLCCLCVHLDSI